MPVLLEVDGTNEKMMKSKKKKKHKKSKKSKEGERRLLEHNEDIEQPVEGLEGYKQKKKNKKRKAEKLEDLQDDAPKIKKKKKLKDGKHFGGIAKEGYQDVAVEKEKKRSLELDKTQEQEDIQHKQQRKKKKKKSGRKVKTRENDENKKSFECNEESVKKKSRKKDKQGKLQSNETTENQKLLEQNKLKSKVRKERKTKAKPEEVSSFDEDVNPIHFEWNPSDEIKQKFKIRQGRWTKMEEKILKENMEQYLLENNLDDPSKLIFAHLHNIESEEGRKWKEFAKTTDFYRKLGKGINRSIFFIYRKVLRSFDEGNYLGPFSEFEDRELEKLVTIHGKKWEKIGRMMGRSGLAVNHRYNWNSGIRGKWKDSEVDLLREAVRKVTNTTEGEEVFVNINWNAVASIVKTRNSDQCRKKWLSEVCWKDSSLAPWRKWGAREDLKLIKQVYESSATGEYDIDWCKLHKDFELSRSPEWLNLKFKIILRKYCNSIDLENTDFEDIIDYLYNVKSKELQDKYCDHQDSSLE